MLKQWDKAIEELAKNDDIMSNIISQYPKERMIMKILGFVKMKKKKILQ